MKNLILLLVAIVTISLSSFGQAPEGFKYQAVVRDAGNLILNNQAVGMQLTIQQGSIGGTAVYTETFGTTTNAYGLVNLEIGTGTTSDDFTTIDWANGPYFMETAVDMTGGTAYSVMGTSQLMSVPYALHAKTAENVNTYTGGDGIDVNGTVVAETKYQIGDFVQGGIVFWLDDTGEHGLVCAKTNQSSGIRWYAGTYTITLAYGDGSFSGEANTFLTIASQGPGDLTTYAALLCNSLQISVGGKSYGDWYLPSKKELNLMYLNKGTIDATALANGGHAFANSGYWSSTEYDGNFAWGQNLEVGLIFQGIKEVTHYVRAIRAF